MKILLIEDDLSLVNGLSFALRKQGYELETARTKAEADAQWAKGGYDLAILDVSLPDGSGFDICRDIRRTSHTPIIFLTAADEETDVIMGLDMGGDDYITKPFKLAIFLSRVHAILRRSRQPERTGAQLHSNGVEADLLTGKVYRNGERAELTASEFRLLCLFMENPDRIFSPEQLLGKLWDCSEKYVDNNTLTVYIRRLRTKIEDDPGRPRRIVTVRGMGYKWNTSD